MLCLRLGPAGPLAIHNNNGNNNCNKNTTAEYTAMGHSIRTSDGWRYTRWLRWLPEQLAPDWESDGYGEELYDLRHDTPDGDFDAQSDNVATDPANAELVASLRKALREAFSAAVGG